MVAATTAAALKARAKRVARQLVENARRMPRPVVVDFETFGIEPRPAYPPRPVGVSIKYPGKRPRYYAFGHPTGNSCTEAQARAALKAAYRWKDGLLFQNGKFDLDVAEAAWGLKVPPWSKVHDTMFLIFLDDPNQRTFSLKPSAERLLGMPPEERDAVRDWLLEREPALPPCVLCKECDARRAEGKEPSPKISKSEASPHYWAKYIALAPGDLVGRYADGDVVRTERLFYLLWPKCKRRGMLPAYDRERMLMPCLLDMERQGVPVHHERLRQDVAKYRGWMRRVDAWLTKELRAKPDINLDSGDELFAAMLKAKKVDRSRALHTASSTPARPRYQTNKEALLLAVKDPQLLAVLKYRAQLKTCLGTFMEPWLRLADMAVEKGLVSKEMRKAKLSLIFTSWNQVKGDARGGSVGARTGRLSSTPNFQNLPKHFDAIFFHEEPDRKKRKALPGCPIPQLPSLPQVRAYVAPFPGEALIDRDYSQQEPRILAHFDGGRIMKLYLDDPWMDFHDKVREELAARGLHYERRPVKNTGLGLIYGMGVGKLAIKTGLPVKEAQRLKQAILSILVGLKEMYADTKRRAAEGKPVRTWGGREYHCEPPAIVEGRMRTFEYKLVNVIVQGSAADCTKEAIVRFYAVKPKRCRVYFNVHDQLTASTPRRHAAEDMETMRLAMESVEFDVQILTEGSTSDESWADLEDYDKRGKLVNQRRAT